jgi:glycosyltransferase involved in cell wall biosynthesis
MQFSLALARQTLRFAAAVIAPSHHAKGDIVRVLGVPARKIHVTPEAADRRFRPLTETERSDRSVPERFGIRGRYIFNIGGLDVRKNLTTLIRAFHALNDREVRLVIAGSEHADNPVVYPPLRPLIDELGVQDRVILAGRVLEEDKLALLQHADHYATPTLYEGFGLPVLEAMACGVPVVASNRTSLPEVVGDAGLLVEPRVEPFALAMKAVLDSEAERTRLAAAGLKRAREFSWERTARETVAVYRSVLGKEQMV